MSAMNDSEEITSDREEIRRICTYFCKRRYNQTVSKPESTMKSSLDTEELVILLQQRDFKDFKNYMPISLLSHSYNIFTRLLQTIENKNNYPPPKKKKKQKKKKKKPQPNNNNNNNNNKPTPG